MENQNKLSTIDFDHYWKRREGISTDSGTTLETFRPVIPWQDECLNAILNEYDYSVGTHDVLLSGSVGSAKSILLAHLAISHCIRHSKACVGIFRISFPDLRDTIFKDIIEHLTSENLIDGKDYTINQTRAQITFKNGSTIVTRSFSDKRYTKVRSLRLSMAIFEEATEFQGDHEQAFKEVKNRLGRIPHIKENLCILASNPDSPSHWIYSYFIENEGIDPTRHVFYSLTFDNPFLNESYIRSILRSLDERQVMRMVFGKWLELRTDIIYYAYGEHNFIKQNYIVDTSKPIHIAWDFNIGNGKPLSCICFQVVQDSEGLTFHFFHEVVIEGMRTLDSCEQLDADGIFSKYGNSFIIHGDAAGAHNDTRSKKTDYDLIMGFMQNHPLTMQVMKKVPPANPPIRTRHNKVNSYCKNGLGEVRLFIYQTCPTANKGMRLTKLKDAGAYIEDDSPSCPYQHITTAMGYGIIATERYYENLKSYETAMRLKNG